MVEGTARTGCRTKDLIRRLKPGDIAVIDHQDLDELAAEDLVKARVKAVINAASSITGAFPNPGPRLLTSHGILLLDDAGCGILDAISNGAWITIDDQGNIETEEGVIGRGEIVTNEVIDRCLAKAQENLYPCLEAFLSNTLTYAWKERDLILKRPQVPDLDTKIENRQVVVVVRGSNYRQDLGAIRSYIDEVRPVLIGVDGGADALVEFGYRPDIIIGDMDSVSDETLKCGAELIVHAYPDGRAPGMDRLESLCIPARTFPSTGTSEDVALHLAYEKGAALIVAVGTHTNMIDFLQKGRKGMASTLLVRLKVGSILVDARGVSQLYKGSSSRFAYLLQLIIAAGVPLLILISYFNPFVHLLRLLMLRAQLLFGF